MFKSIWQRRRNLYPLIEDDLIPANKSTHVLSKAIAYAVAFCFVLQAPVLQANVDKASPFQVYFSTADKYGSPYKDAKTQFDCSDKIYTVLELEDYEIGRHQLSVTWQDPEANTREKTTYPFSFRGKKIRLWSWLTLSRATGAAMIQWIDPAAGLEEFIGEWSVEVRINDKLLKRDQFQVSC